MKRFVIEREIPNVGSLAPSQLREVAAKSNETLASLAPKVQWEHSYVSGDRTFCIYLAESENDVREHARIGGFPVTRIYEVGRVIDPTSAAS